MLEVLHTIGHKNAEQTCIKLQAQKFSIGPLESVSDIAPYLEEYEDTPHICKCTQSTSLSRGIQGIYSVYPQTP